MPQLTATIVTPDETFQRQVARLLRAGGVPVGLVDSRRAAPDSAGPDVAVVDLRTDQSTGLSSVERVRAAHPGAVIFAIAAVAEPETILQAMRAGANEFFAWPADAASLAPPVEEALHGAVRRAAARRDAAQATTRQPTVTHVFLGAKGGSGTTTVSVNCAVELARLTRRPTIIVDLKPSLGEVALFLGVRPRFTVLDAIENLHRLDKDFLRELVARHKSGLDILAGSEQFDRPNAQDASAVEEVLRALGRLYDQIVVDAGSSLSACSAAALFTADSIFLVANPDVPSIRNAQRLIDRVRQLGAGGERIRVLLNRDSEDQLIAPKQIESALGYSIHHSFSSDYRTVSTALNSGVPLSLANHSEIAEQFGRFARHLVGAPSDTEKAPAEKKRAFLGLL
jgi:pilus assembly protein CpaE